MTNWDGRGLVSTEWLAANLGDAALRLYDVTVHLRPATPGPYNVESGRADYEAGHIPGAAFLDLVEQSDIVARVLLAVLAIMSAISWYLIVYKGIGQIVRRTRSQKFLAFFWAATSLEEVQHELDLRGANEPFGPPPWAGRPDSVRGSARPGRPGCAAHGRVWVR